jgi:hypothetical protein
MEFVDQLEATTKLEPEQRWTEYQRINNEVDHLSVLFYMTKMLLPAFGTIGMIELRANTQVDCARAALGVERFRLAEGRLPESLDELVPTNSLRRCRSIRLTESRCGTSGWKRATRSIRSAKTARITGGFRNPRCKRMRSSICRLRWKGHDIDY